MFIVWERDTGYSDESMRFATFDECVTYIVNAGGNDGTHGIRTERSF